MSMQRLSTSIAGGVKTFGIDPMTILTIVSTLLPILAKCFQGEQSSQTPQQYLADHYDESTGTFDQHLVDRARPQTRRAARQNGQRHLTREQLDAITVESFRQTKDADDATVAACFAELPPS